MLATVILTGYVEKSNLIFTNNLFGKGDLVIFAA